MRSMQSVFRKWRAILGKDEESRKFAAEYEQMKQLISTKLWNENDGIYENRFWNGEFSGRLSPTSFYPLFAGIATQKQAERMVKEHLLNPKEFWGTYVIPSISRNDPAFADQHYWRGSIWGLTNYMVYQGLKRYKFDSTSFEFAQKSFDLFMDDWRLNQHDNELYLASGGRGKGDPHYTFGALLPLIATEEYIDKNPWDGLRFGVAESHIGWRVPRGDLGRPHLRHHHWAAKDGARSRWSAYASRQMRAWWCESIRPKRIVYPSLSLVNGARG